MTDDSHRYHHGNLRLALLNAAIELLKEGDIRSVSMRKVAKKAGVSQAAPYHHFSNKESLLAEVSRTGFEDLTSRLVAVSRENSIGALREMGKKYLEFAAQRPSVYNLMLGTTFCDPEDHAMLKEAAGCSFEILTELIAEGQERGSFCCDADAMELAVSVWSSMHGLVSLLSTRLHDGKEMNNGRSVDVGRLIECHFDCITRALVA